MRVTLGALAMVSFLVSSARAEGDGQLPASSTAELAQDGAFLPETVASSVAQNHVTALGLGGFDAAPGQGAVLSAVVEGALNHRVAIRVGTERVGSTNPANAMAGVRVALLDQRRYGVELGVEAQYKNSGFSEVNGELEFLVTVGRRWGRLGVFGNAVLGEGLKDSNERDAEARVASLFALTPRFTIGVDARARFDLGHETAARAMSKLENDFDLLAGPLISYSVGPALLIAQAGAHTFLSHEQMKGGVAAIGGLGYSF